MAAEDNIEVARPAPEPEPETKPEQRGPTTYIVLLKRDDLGVGVWEQIGTSQGSSNVAALRAHFGEDILEGTFVAIPERSWQPKTVGVETQTRIVLA